jgi:hypothetical protein
VETSRKTIGYLVRAGVLREITGYIRNRIYQADEILKTMQGE